MPRLMAAMYDRTMADTEAACLWDWRAELLDGATGDVLEIGPGTGLNLAHYGAGVGRLVLAEPDPYMRERLQQKVDRLVPAFAVEVCDAAAGALPFPDESFDTVVSTLVLCSVPDPEQALGEIHRVLRPGGRFTYLEHVAAVDKPKRHRWQRRLEPFWRRLAGNCHLTRTTDQAIPAAGFSPVEERRESMRRSPAWVRTTVRGHADKPA